MLETKQVNFEGSNYDQAVKKAEQHFNTSKDSLDITIIEDNSNSGLFKKKTTKITASVKEKLSDDNAALDSKDTEPEEIKEVSFDKSDFVLTYREDGVYLKLDDSKKFLGNKRRMEVLDYINRKEIKNLDSKLIIPILSGSYGKSTKKADEDSDGADKILKEFGSIIAPPQKEKYARSKILVLLKEKYLKAYIKLSLPDVMAKPITSDEILQSLEADGIVHGIIMENIFSFVENPIFDTDYLVAEGDLPITGDDAVINILFKTEHDGKAKADNDEKVDYWNLDLFASAIEGQELIRKTPAKEGTNGKTVRGDILPANKGKDKRIPIGKNTDISEDGLILFATCAGRVDIENDRVNVSSKLDIKSNVDLSVGNLEFDGDINIRGNIIAGITIKATGDITIGGAVAAAKIFAGKNIFIRGGMNGGFKGELHAENIHSKFLEQTTVVAKNNVFSEYILDCNVSAGNSINVLDGRGLILSGQSRAGKYIAALLIGNTYNISTNIQIGIDTSIYKTLEKKISQLEQQSKSVSMLLVQAKSRPELFTEEKINQIRVTLQNYQDQIKSSLAQIESTKKANKYAQAHGRIHVFKYIYPGVSMGIGNNKYVVSRQNKYCSYKNDGADIIFSECETTIDTLKKP